MRTQPPSGGGCCWLSSVPSRKPTLKSAGAELTFVIIGGGPTGVELAGTIAELAHVTLPGEFRNIDTRRDQAWCWSRLGDRILPAFKPALSGYAKTALERLGVTVELGATGLGLRCRRRCLRRHSAAGQDDHLGGRRRGFTGRAVARRAGRSGRAGDRRTRPDGARPSGNLRHRRHGASRCGRAAGFVPGIAPAAKQAGKHVAANRSRKARRRYSNAAVHLQTRRRSRDHWQAGSRDRFRTVQLHRLAGLVAVGHRPHLLPDRLAQPAGGGAELAVDLHDRPAQRPAHHAGAGWRASVTITSIAMSCGCGWIVAMACCPYPTPNTRVGVSTRRRACGRRSRRRSRADSGPDRIRRLAQSPRRGAQDLRRLRRGSGCSRRRAPASPPASPGAEQQRRTLQDDDGKRRAPATSLRRVPSTRRRSGSPRNGQ